MTIIQKFNIYTYQSVHYVPTREEGVHDDKNSATWEPLDESSYIQDVEPIKRAYPGAKFYLLMTREENHRIHPIVEIEGKRYYFYSQADKGRPAVDENYIAEYEKCQKLESRPELKTLKCLDRTIALMEFIDVKTPCFRKEADLALLIDLIVQFSLNKKGLDMLPCCLAIKEGKLYCVDHKLNYVTFPTEIEAFKANIRMLKGKIGYWNRGEERQLFSFIDKAVQPHQIPIFEKMLENYSYVHTSPGSIPPSSLNSEEKVSLIAAALRKFGTTQLNWFASTYGLSIEEQKKAIELAGDRLIRNTTVWKEAGSSKLRDKAEKVLKDNGLEGKFAMYENHVGNWKSVLTVQLDAGIFVVREVDQDYIDRYQQQKEKEHRPDYRTFPLGGNPVLFLAKFMGSQTFDYADEKHLDLVIDLALHFSKDERSVIDFNRGNLVVEEGKLHYIDKDLWHWADPMADPRLTNLKRVFYEIKRYFHVEHERVRYKKIVEGKVKSLLKPDDPKDREILEALFPKEFKPIVIEPLVESFEELKLPKIFSSFDEFLKDINMHNEDDRKRLMRESPNYFKITKEDLMTIPSRVCEVTLKARNSGFPQWREYSNSFRKKMRQFILDNVVVVDSET
jgi:hypothetical protein